MTALVALVAFAISAVVYVRACAWLDQQENRAS